LAAVDAVGFWGGALVLIFVSVLLGTLCIGALWSVLSAISGGWSSTFALLAALAIVAMLQFNGVKAGFWRALLAPFLLALSMAYQAYIQAAATVASQMGLGLYETARSLGPEFAFAVVRAQTDMTMLLFYAAALLLAAVLGYFWFRRASPNAPAKSARK
jgi:hypothetical protein